MAKKVNRLLVPQARDGMNNFKWEVANELGIDIPDKNYWGNVTARDAGAVGGNMVRKMVKQYQQNLGQPTE